MAHSRKPKLVSMLYECGSGYIWNMEMYTAKGKMLEYTIFLAVSYNLEHNHHSGPG
jgi:hypothetical protein